MSNYLMNGPVSQTVQVHKLACGVLCLHCAKHPSCQLTHPVQRQALQDGQYVKCNRQPGDADLPQPGALRFPRIEVLSVNSSSSISWSPSVP